MISPLLLALFACSSGPALTDADLDTLSMTRIKEGVDLLADDELGGRVPGSPGHDDAVDWLDGQMQDAGLMPATGDDFEVPFDLPNPRQRFMFNEDGVVIRATPIEGTNLLGVIPGSDPELADRYIAVVAHYDHLGVTEDGDVYNGAYDDATATVALLELARMLVNEDVKLRRSVLVFLSDGEEHGLLGSAAWVDDPTLALEDIDAVISVDPLGRPVLPDFWPFIMLGAERSPELREQLDRVTAESRADIFYMNRAPLFMFGSDQDSFWEGTTPVPAVWAASPGMTWYHQTGDEAETIDYRTVQDHLRFVARATVHLANTDADVTYADHGEQELAYQDAVDGLAFINAILQSNELTDDERGELLTLQGQVEGIVNRGHVEEDDGLSVLTLTIAQMVTMQLAPAHPGPIPPPFPE